MFYIFTFYADNYFSFDFPASWHIFISKRAGQNMNNLYGYFLLFYQSPPFSPRYHYRAADKIMPIFRLLHFRRLIYASFTSSSMISRLPLDALLTIFHTTACADVAVAHSSPADAQRRAALSPRWAFDVESVLYSAPRCLVWPSASLYRDK